MSETDTAKGDVEKVGAFVSDINDYRYPPGMCNPTQRIIEEWPTVAATILGKLDPSILKMSTELSTARGTTDGWKRESEGRMKILKKQREQLAVKDTAIERKDTLLRTALSVCDEQCKRFNFLGKFHNELSRIIAMIDTELSPPSDGGE